jgi:hypothetical protein
MYHQRRVRALPTVEINVIVRFHSSTLNLLCR